MTEPPNHGGYQPTGGPVNPVPPTERKRAIPVCSQCGRPKGGIAIPCCPPTGSQPIRQGDNTREFLVKWHAVQLAKCFLAFVQPGEQPDSAQVIEIATAFAVTSRFTQEEHAVFMHLVLSTVAGGGGKP